MGKRVVVFGAGVAGLTAAHELAVRGYAVTVYETKAVVGGRSRTQYAAPVPDGVGFKQMLKDEPLATVAAAQAAGKIDAAGNPSTKLTDPRKLLPGEHGYRFFPAFYRHLNETMRRTPIVEEVAPGTWKARADRRTTLDNLHPTTVLGYAAADGLRVHRFTRRKLGLRDLVQMLRDFLSTVGATFEDTVIIELAILQFMTTCAERRTAELEHLSWWDFMEASRLSPQAQAWVQKTPEALVAMDAKESDARTYGAVSVQLLLDQLSDGLETDRTMTGPTSEAWLEHWQNFLQHSLGVKFNLNHSLDKIKLLPGDAPQFDVQGPGGGPPLELRHAVDFEFAVLALPLYALVKVLTASFPMPMPTVDLQRAVQFHNASPYGYQSGIQFYLTERVHFLEGHLYCLNSAWGLSAIAQSQFWREDMLNAYGIGTVISVDVGIWEAVGSNGKRALDCTEEEFADEVWHQLREATGVSGGNANAVGASTTPWTHLPLKPRFYHADADVRFNVPAVGAVRFMINRPSEFALRPGRIGDGVTQTFQAYELQFNGTTGMCGDYLQTYTRITTMEAANEAARHACNAIMEKDAYDGERCTIYPMELWELPELEPFLALDRDRFNRGDPHLVTTLHARDWLQLLIP
ncbi:MAG: FAD-dependent oxidoreductase [Deltaproteobacteria bacterium]|nr:FAD-dependent oxidoreductase [Deltaproteobacteria bacterium]